MSFGKNDISRFLGCGVINISRLKGHFSYNYTVGMRAGALMIYTSYDHLLLWTLEPSGLRCQNFSCPAYRRPMIETQVNVSEVSIYSIFLSNATFPLYV